MTVKELKEQLSKFSDDTEVMIYEDHFDNCEPCNGVQETGYYHTKEPGKCFIHVWAS